MLVTASLTAVVAILLLVGRETKLEEVRIK